MRNQLIKNLLHYFIFENFKQWEFTRDYLYSKLFKFL